MPSNVQPSEILRPGDYDFAVTKVGSISLDGDRVPGAVIRIDAPGTPQDGRRLTVRWPESEPTPSPGFRYRATFSVHAAALVGGRWVEVDPYEHRETNPRVRYAIERLGYASMLPSADVKTERKEFHTRRRRPA